MRRIFALFALLTLAAGLSACGSDTKVKVVLQHSTVHATIDTYRDKRLIEPQTITIALGGHATWPVEVDVRNNTAIDLLVELAVKSVSNAEAARSLNLPSKTIGSEQDGSFTAQLPAGTYDLAVNGRPTDYIIILVPSPPSAGATTTTRV